MLNIGKICSIFCKTQDIKGKFSCTSARAQKESLLIRLISMAAFVFL